MKLSDLIAELKLAPRDATTVLKGLGMAGIKRTEPLTDTQEATIRALMAYKVANAAQKLTWGRAVAQYVQENPMAVMQVEADADVQVRAAAPPEPEAAPAPAPTAEELAEDPYHQAQEDADSEGVSAIQGVVQEMAEQSDKLSTQLATGFVASIYMGVSAKLNSPAIHATPEVQAAKAGFKALNLMGAAKRPLVKSLPSGSQHSLPGVKTPSLPGSKSRSTLQSELPQTSSEATVAL